MSEFVTITGLDQIKAVFARLPGDVARKVLPKVTNAGAIVFRDASRTLAPQAAGPIYRSGLVTQPGTLKRSIIAKFLRADSNDTQAVSIVTVRRGRGIQRTGAFYARYVEFGHASRNGSEVQGRRFLTNAFNANIERTVKVCIAAAEFELQKLPEFQ